MSADAEIDAKMQRVAEEDAAIRAGQAAERFRVAPITAICPSPNGLFAVKGGRLFERIRDNKPSSDHTTAYGERWLWIERDGPEAKKPE